MKNEAEETTNAYGLSHISFFLFRISRYALDILFPPLCAYCEAYLNDETAPLCNMCLATIVKQTALICPICNARMADNKNICTHGKSKRDQYPYLLGAATHYADPIIRACIHQCKYEKVHSLAPVFATLLVEYINALDPKPRLLSASPIVVPIPLHMHKERNRGFNQSALIARSFARTIQLPYDELLIKLIDNDPQAQTKKRIARLARMHGAFAVPRLAAVRNKTIILIDDVSTSGATLSEAARTLKQAGAKKIFALVVAKA
ncbi:hypothetical protein A2524_01030 [Candidatus Wolfebacteria bacterium RIFOXYD12_FULL_48_21]|uniref:Phosphoribosyltransferase domain-containing protein n=1 Tax=Candidatus Wolfebacteria bacterium RIFOXYD1_FULL_48_65 TaxID=1802561 RepID=A0A1F8E1K5_9BACT|nr:MAG: hypothetical protein A2610_02975 [Candidatus Wolfebacteria bacterium RIFOXYD1_FULL_48_65]OGM94392.1 MAG: hypothetical protein A2524_01030 [Candidatus Wolfebacteria bacterium RIFOXYD12_FULL_48_21]